MPMSHRRSSRTASLKTTSLGDQGNGHNRHTIDVQPMDARGARDLIWGVPLGASPLAIAIGS
jgi:hypothetical protein